MDELLKSLWVLVQEVDDQLSLWEALHDHCEQYLSAIVKSLDRQSSADLGIPSCVRHMEHISILLDSSQHQTVQNLYKPLQSSLLKLNKVESRIVSLAIKGRSQCTQNKDYETMESILLDPKISFYLDLLDSASREISKEYHTIKKVFMDIRTTTSDENRDALLEKYNSRRYYKFIREKFDLLGLQ